MNGGNDLKNIKCPKMFILAIPLPKANILQKTQPCQHFLIKKVKISIEFLAVFGY